MTEAYEIALKKATAALWKLDLKVMEIERERAKLRQTVAVLQSQLGITPQNIESLTEAILLVLKAWPGCMTTSEILQRLTAMGYQPHRTSVSTLLSRLTRQGKIVSLIGPGGAVGYEWKTEVPKAERLNAQKELASKSPKKK
jgi:predicted transcriptional regulator